MLWQLHHQFKDHTEMIAQAEIDSHDEAKALFDSMRDQHPLPEGAQWMFCNENAPEFVVTPIE
jgi:hypothetical protein